MKKIFGLLSIIMLCFVLVGCKKDEKYIFLGKQYESLKHIHEDDILEHVKLVSTLYPETSIDNFTDEEISIITIFKLMMNGETTTDEEIQKYVKNLFGKDKFNFEEGTYINPVPYQEDYDKIVVLKENGKYSSNLYGYGLNDPTNHFNSIEIKDIPGVDYFQTNNLKIEFSEEPNISWGIDGEEFISKEKVYEFRMEKNMKMQIFVIVLIAVKLGFQKKIVLLDGKKNHK